MKLHDIKNSRWAVLGGLAALAVCATAARADGGSSGWYVSSDAGLNLMPGVVGAVKTAAAPAPEDPKVRLDVGGRFGLEGGYGFKLADQLTLSVEAESGVAWNQLSSITSGSPGAEKAAGGNLYQIPILANVILNYHIDKWTPYIGAGGGIDYVSLNQYSSGGAPVGTPRAGDDFGPAIQGVAGVRYQLNSQWAVGVGYKYLVAFSERLAGFRASNIQSHDFCLNITYLF